MTGTIHAQNTSWWNPSRIAAYKPSLSTLGKIPSLLKQAVVRTSTTATYTIGTACEKASSAYNRGKEAAIHWALKNHPEMCLRLHILLEEFQKSTSGEKTFSRAARDELAERLEEFVKECSPTAQEKTVLERLCIDLRNSSVSFDQTQQENRLELLKILTPHLKKHAAYIDAKMAERHALEQLPGVAYESPVINSSKEETIQGIEDQIELLKSNSIKLVLGSIMLYTTLGISTLKEINPGAQNLDFVKILGIDPANSEGDLVKLLIEASNQMKVEGKNSDEIFKMLIDRVIDNSDRNIFSRYHAKFRCGYMSKLISSYMANLFDKLKDSLVYFAHLPPAEQLEHISVLLINPLADHLSEAEKGYAAVAQDQALLQGHHQKIAGSVSNMLAALLRQNKSGEQTPDQLLDNFIEVFLDQFIDPVHQHWTRKARVACLEKASRSTFFVKWTFRALAGLSWTAGKIIAPFQWTLNEAIRLILRKTIVSLFPGLFGATKNALQIGDTHSWHSLKKNIVLMLQKTRLQRLKPRSEDPYLPQPAVPAASSERFNALIDQLLKVMASQDAHAHPNKAPASHAILEIVMKGLNLQEASAAQNDLTDYLGKDGKVVVQHLQYQLHDILKTTISDLAATMCAQEGFFNTTLLSSLTSTNASSFSAQIVVVSKEEKESVEAEFQKELALLSENILQDLKRNSTDKRYQAAANIYVNTIKQEVHLFEREFSQIFKNPDLSTLENFKSLYLKFTQSLQQLRKKIHEKVDASTEALLIPSIEHSLASAAKGWELLAKLETNKTEVEKTLDHLGMLLKNPADAEEELYADLVQLRALSSPSFNASAFEAELMQCMGTYSAQALDPQLREKHPRALVQPFTKLIADYKEKYKKAHRQEKIQKIELCKAELLSLTEWANSLKFIQVTAKPTAADAGLALAYGTPLAHSVASSLLQSYGKNFFHFIGQECHIDGIAQRTMRAYIHKPFMQRKAIVTRVPLRQRILKLHPNIAKLSALDWAVFMAP